MKFEFSTPSRILFGPGALQEAGALARSMGDRAFVVTGRDESRAQPLRQLLHEAGVASGSFPVPGEPTIPLADEATAFARREKCNLVIGFGGGSALDTAKAVAALLANDGLALNYVEIIGANKPLEHPSIPCIAIPTTAGTGAEATRNSVLASPERRLKVSLRGPGMMPRAAIIDPLLTHSMPPSITAFTGMDALTQVIEPFTCGRANPMTDGLCREGITRAARSLRVTFHEPTNSAAREDMCVASLFGGMALANAGLGAVHGIAGPMGGTYDAPHGAICAALLPHVMRANQKALRERQPQSGALARYEEIAQILTGQGAAAAEDGVEWVQALVAEMQVPPLSTHGVKSEHFPEIAEKAARANSMKANPIQLTAEELTAILAAACR